ncbi:hypothetical protein K438DRAFT_1984981 [Mycena galopus ATCC 62051]|nr:hypothetical protein K438DRAFT_1984981 [Mycena galopus ATCC 62051]
MPVKSARTGAARARRHGELVAHILVQRSWHVCAHTPGLISALDADRVQMRRIELVDVDQLLEDRRIDALAIHDGLDIDIELEPAAPDPPKPSPDSHSELVAAAKRSPRKCKPTAPFEMEPDAKRAWVQPDVRGELQVPCLNLARGVHAPEDYDKFIICQMPYDTEGDGSLRRTIDSLA